MDTIFDKKGKVLNKIRSLLFFYAQEIILTAVLRVP